MTRIEVTSLLEIRSVLLDSKYPSATASSSANVFALCAQ